MPHSSFVEEGIYSWIRLRTHRFSQMPWLIQSIDTSEKGEAITHSSIPSEKQSGNGNGSVLCPEHVLTLRNSRLGSCLLSVVWRIEQDTEARKTSFYLPWIFNTTPAIYPKSIQPSIDVSPNQVSIDIIIIPMEINQTASRI